MKMLHCHVVLTTSSLKTIKSKLSNFLLMQSNNLLDKYEVMQKIGRGKYSDVFKCINTEDDKLYVLKFLKPVRDSKIRR